MGWIETYLNNPKIQVELGMHGAQGALSASAAIDGADHLQLAEGLEFKSCNMQINQAFLLQVRRLSFFDTILRRPGLTFALPFRATACTTRPAS